MMSRLDLGEPREVKVKGGDTKTVLVNPSSAPKQARWGADRILDNLDLEAARIVEISEDMHRQVTDMSR